MLFVLMIDFFVFHFLFPAKRTEILHGLNEAVSAELNKDGSKKESKADDNCMDSEETASLDATCTLPTANPGSDSEQDNFAAEFAKCRGILHLGYSSNADEIMLNLNKDWHVISSAKELENYHFELPDGKKRRVHFIYDINADGKIETEMRLFAVDSNGLPDRIQLPAHETFNPSEQTKKKYMNLGKLILHHERTSFAFKEGQVTTESVDSKITDISIVSESKSFNCHLRQCLCK